MMFGKFLKFDAPEGGSNMRIVLDDRAMFKIL